MKSHIYLYMFFRVFLFLLAKDVLKKAKSMQIKRCLQVLVCPKEAVDFRLAKKTLRNCRRNGGWMAGLYHDALQLVQYKKC